MIEKPAISIVIPVYNEEESVLLLYQRVRTACDLIRQPYEIIFVDDGSRDRTFTTIARIHGQDPRIKVIRFRKNYGQTAAMVAGFEYAKGEIIVSMDGDLQNDPSDVPRLLSKIEEGFDVICGWRRNRQDKFWTRRLPSVIANWIIGRITGIRIHDNGCSLKAYRASVIKNVALYGEMHRFIPAMATLAGARIAEIEVRHHPRRFGTSKYGIGRIWRVVLDIITVKLVTGFASRPALWFGLPSFPLILWGLGVLLVTSGVYPIVDVTEDWMVMSAVAFLLLFLGVHLFSLGIIGELSMNTGDYHPQKTLQPTLKSL